MISRPLNFLSLLAFLRAVRDSSLLYKKDKKRKYGITEHEWREWIEFCKRRGLIEVKSMGKKRGRKPIITEKGERILEKLEALNMFYAGVIGDIYERADSEADNGS